MKFRKIKKHSDNVGKYQARKWVEWTRRWAGRLLAGHRVVGPLYEWNCMHRQVMAYANAGLIRKAPPQ
jgi:hypothetical protein